MQKLSKNLLIVLGITLNLTSCSHNPPDVPAFLDLNSNTGYYVYTISNREGYVNNTDKPFVDEKLSPTPLKWNDIKKKSVILPSFSWELVNAYIATMCEKNKQKCEEAGNPEVKSERFNSIKTHLNNLELENEVTEEIQ